MGTHFKVTDERLKTSSKKDSATNVLLEIWVIFPEQLFWKRTWRLLLEVPRDLLSEIILTPSPSKDRYSPHEIEKPRQYSAPAGNVLSACLIEV